MATALVDVAAAHLGTKPVRLQARVAWWNHELHSLYTRLRRLKRHHTPQARTRYTRLRKQFNELAIGPPPAYAPSSAKATLKSPGSAQDATVANDRHAISPAFVVTLTPPTTSSRSPSPTTTHPVLLQPNLTPNNPPCETMTMSSELYHAWKTKLQVLTGSESASSRCWCPKPESVPTTSVSSPHVLPTASTQPLDKPSTRRPKPAS